MIWMDEPALLGFGSSTFISISREDVLRDLNEVAGAIHAAGALTGVHCEANTDWSLLMEADLDILDFDAYDHLEAITLYPDELRAFFDRGGSLGWGIVPTLNPQAAATETVESLLARFDAGVARLGSARVCAPPAPAPRAHHAQLRRGHAHPAAGGARVGPAARPGQHAEETRRLCQRMM